ncbi:unnamed protein product (macronuclear) [Paramecium tetraurelia]|uniref:non-specific serine/threonine protein kinase n=1 Tax=Paramecium tetraurelia TaxID=5888 RepID=A0BVD9_PARTE|nr:uncharacterized protein GSPATT00005752001 [Paramecium tetraurelia]CAK62506.1 unnamed protein product [Paramecium tetraurelia]|eukprot:XP_001429904.1 hypothetical protein (macronuclear) [Paramecium tetraurelia strain d4-2]
MGNCIYKSQVDNQAQDTIKQVDGIIDQAIQEENVQKQATSEQLKIIQNEVRALNQESPESNSGSYCSNPQIKYQSDLQLSPNLLIRKQNDGEKFLFHYEIIKKLGQGGFGEVYQVRHLKTKLIRAAKVVIRQSIENESLLFRETEILKTLDHPNIVKILELFSDNQHFYIITECLDGGELLDRVRTITNYSEEIAKTYMKQILSAMIYCHERKIVHRDLKPENILFDTLDINSNLRVIDFGASEKMMSKKLTTKIGTPYYLAPEILRSNGYDEKVDVWSCGVILYILLIGKAPFRGKNRYETLQLAQQAKIEFNAQIIQRISQDALDLIKLMIEKDPNKRISMKEAMSHSWIQMQSQKSLNFDQTFFRNITQFKGYNNLRVAIYQFITIQTLKKEECEKCLEAFKRLDNNGDGVLSEEEILQGMLMVNINQITSQNMIKEIMSQMDTNDSGKIDFTEFITASVMQEKRILKESLRAAFRLFDLDGNGTISRSEIQEIFGGIQIDNNAWQEILTSCDDNKDGLIEENEFLALLENLQ